MPDVRICPKCGNRRDWNKAYVDYWHEEIDHEGFIVRQNRVCHPRLVKCVCAKCSEVILKDKEI